MASVIVIGFSLIDFKPALAAICQECDDDGQNCRYYLCGSPHDYYSFYPDFYPEFYPDFYPDFYPSFYPDFYPAFYPSFYPAFYPSFNPYSSFYPDFDPYSSFYPDFNPYSSFYPSFYPSFNPSVDIKANNSNGPITINWNTSTNLSWTSNDVSSCNASGDWSGSKSTSGSQSTGNLNQVKTYSYTLTCNPSDSVSVVVSAPVPSASSVTVTQPDYCVSGPAATVAWTYSDPSGSPQQSYQIQIDDQGSFANPEVDSGKVNSGSTSYFTGQGVMQFNTTYKARARVWNGYDQVSSWTEMPGNFKTPNFAYPQVNFTWTQNGISEPSSPTKEDPIQFTDQTVFGGNQNQREWSWNFGDSTFSTLQSPSKTYNTEGTYYVTLTAEDSQGQVCARTRGPLIIQKPIPKWKEVAPK